MIHFYKGLLFLLLFLFSPNLFGQLKLKGETSHSAYYIIPHKRTVPSYINIEILGAAGFGSINYERQFSIGKHHRWMYRIGVGGSYIDKNNGAAFAFPLMTHYIVGKKSHYLDISAGVAPSVTSRFSWFVRLPVGIGYRFEHWNRRLYYRISYTPFVSFLADHQYEHWGGVTVGYNLGWH